MGLLTASFISIYSHCIMHIVFEGFHNTLDKLQKVIGNDILAQVIPMRAGCLSVSLKCAILHVGQPESI